MTILHATADQSANPNAPSFETLLASAVELGEQYGKGRDTQVKFDMKVCEGAFLGTLSLDENKHGKDLDDATKLSEAYATAASKAVVFDAKANNQRKLISNVRKMIKLGTTPKWGTAEPMSTVNNLMTEWMKARKDPANKKRLDDAHNTLMRFATAQLKRDVIIDPSEFRTFILKKESDPRTGEEVLEAIRKMANNLKVGKVANCTDMDNSPEVQSIINNCTKRLTAIAKARGPQAPSGPASTP